MEKTYDLIIIGSGPAGLSAAIYAQRAGLDTLVLEKEYISGGQVVNTAEVDNYPGLPGMNGYELGMKFRSHADALEAKFQIAEVKDIIIEETQKTVRTNEGDFYAKNIIISTGASHRKLGVPGERELAGMGVSYCATCDGAFFRGRTVAVVGGGVGCAIAFPQAKTLFTDGREVDVIAGFRTKDLVILEDEMRANSTNYYIMTDDGSYGEKGFVTDKLKELIEAGNKYDAVIAIGPIPMMKFVSLTTKPYGIKTIVSLNPIMVDGTGMCGGCRVTVGGKIKFACVDGPDFDGHQVDYDELMNRNAAYKAQESENRESHVCRMDKLANELIK